MALDAALLKRLDDATNAISARLQTLSDKLAAASAAGGLSAADAQKLSDGMDADIAKLTALGKDPSNPVPATT